MEMDQLDALAAPSQRRIAADIAEYGFEVATGVTATVGEIAAVEEAMGVVLPDKYKAFMMRHGGGMFGFVDLILIADLRKENDWEFPDRTFVVVAPVGTGDYWGFPVTDGRCHDQVWFHFHDYEPDELVAADFLEFAASRLEP